MIYDERNKDFRRAYQRVIADLGDNASRMSINSILNMVIHSPAEALYISPKRVNHLLEDPPIRYSSTNKKLRSYIIRRFSAEHINLINKGISRSELIENIINSPAPSFFISLETASRIIFGR